MKITNKQIEIYTNSFTTPEPDVVLQLIEDSERNLDYTDMMSGRQVGRLLKLLVELKECKRVLEIGTFTGYSALMMAMALPEKGELITCEKNERYSSVSKKYFEQEPFASKIEQRMGDAIETLDIIEGKFDLIFIDADKINYPEYYKKSKNMLEKGGLIVIDNTLWGGTVLKHQEEKAKAIHQMNKMIRNDKDVIQIMIPLRDGLTIVQHAG